MKENNIENKRESKLIALLKSFSAECLTEFRKFIKSPLINTNKKVIQLFEIYSKHFPNLDADGLDKESIYKKLFPGKTYTESTLTNLMFMLTKAAEKYLIDKQIYDDHSEYLLTLSKIYLDNKLPSHFLRTTQSLDKLLTPGFSVQKNFISKYKRLSQLKTIYYTGINDFENLINVKQKYFKQSSINFVMDYMDIIGNETPAKSTHNLSIDSLYIRAVKGSFKIDKFFNIVLKEDPEDLFVKLSFSLYKMLKEPNLETDYKNLRNVFYEVLDEDKKRSDILKTKAISNDSEQIKKKKVSGNKIPGKKKKKLHDEESNLETEDKLPILDREEINTILNYLLNYCTQQYNKKYMLEALEVYKKMLEFDVYTESESDYMQVNIYRNIVLICSSVNEIKWLENFIKDYSDKLSPQYRNNMKNLATAHIQFLKKNYDESLTILSKVSEDFNLIKTDIRNLRLKILYELKSYKQAESLVDSYKQFLNTSNKVAEDNKIYFKVYLHYYKKLITLKPDYIRADLLYLQSLIEKEKRISNKLWLLEKIDELLKKR